jgi:hypothetical protein
MFASIIRQVFSAGQGWQFASSRPKNSPEIQDIPIGDLPWTFKKSGS